MIPKIVHYCWYGKGKKISLIKKCIKSFQKLQPDKIIEWNEDNCSFVENNFIKTAYEQKAWAFVSDYYRLKALYDYGGIYLDTDVMIEKRFPDTFYEANLVLGYMFDCFISTAVIMAAPHHPFIKGLLDLYDNLDFNVIANNAILTDYVIKRYPNFKLNGKFVQLEPNCYIYPKEYFEVPIRPCSKKSTNGGYSVHHFTGFWIHQHGVKAFIRPLFKKILFENHWLNYFYNLYSRKKSLIINPLYNKYLEDSKLTEDKSEKKIKK